jgi:hypothetical protein
LQAGIKSPEITLNPIEGMTGDRCRDGEHLWTQAYHKISRCKWPAMGIAQQETMRHTEITREGANNATENLTSNKKLTFLI